MYFSQVRAICADSAVFIPSSDNDAFVKNKKDKIFRKYRFDSRKKTQKNPQFYPFSVDNAPIMCYSHIIK